MQVFKKFQNIEVFNSSHGVRDSKAPGYVRKSTGTLSQFTGLQGLPAWRSESTELQAHPWHIKIAIASSASLLSSCSYIWGRMQRDIFRNPSDMNPQVIGLLTMQKINEQSSFHTRTRASKIELCQQILICKTRRLLRPCTCETLRLPNILLNLGISSLETNNSLLLSRSHLIQSRVSYITRSSISPQKSSHFHD